MDAGAAMAVCLLAAGESMGKRADGTYVGLSELLPEEDVRKYVGAPVRTAGVCGDGAPVGVTVMPSGRKYTSSTNTAPTRPTRTGAKTSVPGGLVC